MAEGPGSIPGQGTKIPQAAQCSQKKEKQAKQGRKYGKAEVFSGWEEGGKHSFLIYLVSFKVNKSIPMYV